LVLGGGISVSRTAYVVGYVNPSQFSREYRNLFGTPPVVDIGRISRTAGS
jgi:AraC-like DNA-binding protein